MPKTIVILGTKGVGKSTLFGRLVKNHAQPENQKITPLVNYVEKTIKIENQTYQLIDTPSFNLSPKSVIEIAKRQQIEELLTKSDLICWVIKQIDEEALLFNRVLRKYPIPRILIFNPIGEDDFLKEQIFGLEYHSLIPNLTKSNLEKLTKKIVELLPNLNLEETASQDQKVNLLIFGPPNSGKSTLMNYLLQKNRSLVTPLPGTTQEPVISKWNWKKINFHLIDTAGITKQEKISKSWWRKCDLAWAIIDATIPLTKQILQIVNWGEKFAKPLVIIINKSDLFQDNQNLVKIETEIRKRLKSLSYVPVIFLSAWTGNNVLSLLKLSEKMIQKTQQCFSKNKLTNLIQKITTDNPPPSFSGHKLKIYFAKHKIGSAHYFIFFVNNPHWVHFAYQRYLVNRLRTGLDLEYLPIRIIFRKSV